MTTAALRMMMRKASFDPLSLSPAGWWDASVAASITSSGGLVSQWNDLSGNTRHATATSTQRPVTGATTINGLNVIGFDGVNDIMVLPSAQWVSASTGNSMAVAVIKMTSVAGSHLAVSGDGYPSVRNPQWINTSGTAMQATRIDGGVKTDAAGVTLSTATTYIASGVVRASNIESYVNGSTNGASTTTGTNGKNASIGHLGGYGDVPTLAPWAGSLAEVFIFATDLTAANHNLLGNYLAAKWGTTWTTVT